MATTNPGATEVTDIIQRRDECKKWMNLNYWAEWVDTWRAIKCRTRPIYNRDSAGKETNEEDKSRTNVESGLANLIYRKNVARLSAQPYSLRVSGGQDPTVAARLSALLGKQYDNSQEQPEDQRVRMAAEALGIGISKIYWDYISRTMVFRKAILKDGKVVYRDRKSMMKARKASEDEIQQAVEEHSPEMTDEEVQDFMGKSGTELTVPEEVKKYEGPRVMHCFPGDVFWEPFAKTLFQSSFVTHSYRESDLWLKKMLGLTYKDDDGNEVKAFDPEAVANLMRLDPEPVVVKGEFQELKDLFRTAVGKQDQVMYQFPRNLRVRKLYDILEEHKQDDDGRMWITWVNENYRDKVLGKMPYPVNLYGHTAFTDEVPLPDLIDAIGDSTPRLLRYIFSMFNLQMAQNFDYITNLIRVTFLAKTGVEFSQDRLQSAVFNIIRATDMNGLQPVQRPPLPPGAMERGALLLQLIGMFEPSLNLTTEGTESNPQAGKTATTAVLAAKAADVLLAMKMDGRNLYLRQLGMKKIWMNQQMADLDQPWTVESKYFGTPLQSMLKDKKGGEAGWMMTDQTGKIASVKLDPSEIQQDFDVEPEAGSYMAVNDDIRRQSAIELDQIAMQAPGILDTKKVILNHMKTIQNLDGDPESYFLPPPDPNAPPQPQKYSASATISIPLDKMEPSVQQFLLSKYLAMPPDPALEDQSQLNLVGRVSAAADHADNLLSPSSMEQARVGAVNANGPKTPVGIAEASGG